MRNETDASGLVGRLAQQWAKLMASGESDANPGAVADAAVATAPLIWLIGKVQSGKSSVVQGITGADAAEIGTGFKACTKTATVFNFPPQAPVIRFLDTRGLGEANYDAAEDLAVAEGQAHLLLVVMRALDPQQESVLSAVAQVRKRRPDWPIVVAQTCLHEAYKLGEGHRLPYPFDDGSKISTSSMTGVPETLARSLAYQRQLFAGLPGRGQIHFVPIDFTRADDGFEPRLYGHDSLLGALLQAAPAAMQATLAEFSAAGGGQAALKARPLILGHAAVAAAADVVPVAGALAVPGVQARLLHTLASERGIAWDRRMLTEFGACLGGSILTRLAARYGIRQLVKLVPVYGQTVGAAAAAASSFATTYALGQAALVFLSRRERGSNDAAAVAAAYREGLEKAFALARNRGLDAVSKPSKTPTSGQDGGGHAQR